jgi:hypothetical protein
LTEEIYERKNPAKLTRLSTRKIMMRMTAFRDILHILPMKTFMENVKKTEK